MIIRKVVYKVDSKMIASFDRELDATHQKCTSVTKDWSKHWIVGSSYKTTNGYINTSVNNKPIQIMIEVN